MTVAGTRPLVLVVEDDDTTRGALSLLLDRQDYEVVAAANGREALAHLRAGLRPALILLDLIMPVLDGWAFRAEQMSDPALADIPVVVCSGVGDLAKKAGSLRAKALISKPIAFDQLLNAVQASIAQRPLAVLVVDDEPLIRRLLKLALEQRGIRVFAAAGGREATELYRQHRESIGAVLLDVQMPDMDGPWTLAALQRVNPKVRALFISGHTGEYDAETLLAMGAAGILPKPFDLTVLTEKVREVLDAR